MHILARGLSALEIEPDPVDQNVVADQDESVGALRVIEQDAVADQVAVLVDTDQLLRDPGAEVLEGVGRDLDQSRDDIRTVQEQLRHVVALIHEGNRRAPGALLVTPVGELGGDRKSDGRPILVAKKLDSVSDSRDRLRQAL